MALTPAAIARADYGIAQRPTLGGEIEVYACTEAAGIIQKMRNLGGGQYETKVYNAGGFGGIDVVLVGATGLHGAAEPITVPDWVVNKSANFPVGKAGEGELPASFGIRGDELIHVQIPDYDPAAAAEDQIWWEVGCTEDKSIKVPSRMSKAIACGLESAEWVTPGKTEVGELTVSAKNAGHDEGLRKIAGLKCTLMLKVRHERAVETARIFILEWTPTITISDPEGDDTGKVTAVGLFSRFAVLAAPGTPVP